MRLLALLLVAVLLLGCTQQPPAPSQPSQPSQPAQNQGAENQTAPPSAPPTAPPQQAPPAAQNNTTNTPPAQPSAPPLPQIPSKDFTFYSGGWQIHGTDYASSGNSPTKAVILVHDLGQDRSSFPYYMVKRIHDSMPDAVVVTIDMQGNGQSTNLGTWDSFDTDTFKTMKTDIIDLGTKYIAPQHPSVKSYFVVGAGFGSTAAMLAAVQEHRVIKVAMLSPGTDYKGVSIEDAIPDYTQEIFLASSSGDSYSVQSSSTIASIANKLQITKATYDGSAHGTSMFDATESTNDKLSDDLISFLKQP